MKGYTYVLRCADDTLYCGWTNDLTARLAAHNSGKGAKYTRGRGPVTLVYSEMFDTQSEAMQREAAIKKLTRPQKQAPAENARGPSCMRRGCPTMCATCGWSASRMACAACGCSSGSLTGLYFRVALI